MLDNKVLVNLYILSLDKNYELYLPINEKIGNISKLINTTLFDSINFEKNYIFLNVENGKIYENNVLLRDTDILNGTKLVLI